jgi:hypothetical protein
LMLFTFGKVPCGHADPSLSKSSEVSLFESMSVFTR